MKTSFIALLLASILGAAIRISGQAFDANVICAVGFASGLGAWALASCGRTLRPLLPPRASQNRTSLVTLPSIGQKSVSRRMSDRLAA